MLVYASYYNLKFHDDQFGFSTSLTLFLYFKSQEPSDYDFKSYSKWKCWITNGLRITIVVLINRIYKQPKGDFSEIMTYVFYSEKWSNQQKKSKSSQSKFFWIIRCMYTSDSTHIHQEADNISWFYYILYIS